MHGALLKLPTFRHAPESGVAFERPHLRRQQAEADRAAAVTVVDPVDERREFLTAAIVGREQIRLMLAGGNKVEQHDPDRQRFITGHAQPELFEAGQQKAGLARFLKIDLIPPAAEIADPGKMHAQSGAVVVAPPQPLGGFGKQVLREVPGAVIRAQFRLQHMLMADAFGEARGGRLDIDASI